MSKPGEPYSDAEADIVLGYYADLTNNQIQEELRQRGYERTINSIKLFAYSRGAPKKKSYLRWRRWSEEEEHIIIEFYQRGIRRTQQELAKQGYIASSKQIQNKAFELDARVGEDYWS